MKGPNRDYNFEAEELRGAAALLVFFYHSIHTGASTVAGTTGWLSSNNPIAAFVFEGHTGVSLFMVLSGYILASGTFDQEINYWGFLRNRILRIFPLMIVVLVFSMYAAKATDLGSVIAPFLLLANMPFAFQDPSGLAGTVWTISVEFQFYLIAPFLFLFVKRYGVWNFLLPAMLLFWILKVIVLLPLAPDAQYRGNYFTIIGRIDQFLMGIGIAYLVFLKRLRFSDNRLQGVIFLVISSAGLLCLTSLLNRQGGLAVWHMWHLIYPEIEGLLWALFIVGYSAFHPFRESVVSRALRWVGTLSFSIYILHYAIQREWWIAFRYKIFGEVQTGMLGVFIISCGILVTVIALSSLSYRCIERPFLDMRRKYLVSNTRLKLVHEEDDQNSLRARDTGPAR